MKRFPKHRPAARHLLATALAATLFTIPLPSLAATIALASQPLTTTTASNVKPNVMFIFDDSGSMAGNFLPDWAGNNHPITNIAYANMPTIFTNSGFNGVAYNPAVTYLPPVFYNADGTLNTTTYPGFGSPWTQVKRDGYGVLTTATDSLVNNASFYTFINGEYCSNVKKISCVTSAAPTSVAGVTYNTPAGLRWCNNTALTNCQSINTSTYKYPRYPGLTSTARIAISSGGNATSIKVSGYEILSTTASGGSGSALISDIVAKINACTAAITGSCTIAGASAIGTNTNVYVYSPKALGGGITSLPVVAGTMTKAIYAFDGIWVPGSNVYTNVVSSNNSYSYAGTTSAAPTRTDCTVGAPCTYAQEMTNYANWWAYYHTRNQAMKTSVSRAFKALNANYRVGFSTISDTAATLGTNFLPVGTFELVQKNNWFKKLFAAQASTYTPLRGALSKTGRYFAHKVGSPDPVQYSCQQNFAIMSTDGYWNTNDETATFGPYGVNGGNVGDLDNVAPTALPSNGMYQGPTATSNTLADVAKYYYDTDLRDSALWNNCAGASSPDYPSGNPNVCPNNVFTSATDNQPQQHMTTFTMGLGADGVLNFQTDYATATSGDFYDMINALGSPRTYWSVPVADNATAIDDLWHAAVNGRGQYFSAKDPDAIIAGFNSAISSITAKLGSAAAAATSTLNPVAGNNFVYLASYTTVKWTGNLEARAINTSTAVVSDTSTWCAENVVADTCALPATVQLDNSGAGNVYNCVLTNTTLAACPSPGTFDSSTNTCTTEITKVCTGTLPPLVHPATDDRTIWTAASSGHSLIAFDSAFAAANSTLFDAAHVNTLTQWPSISSNHTPDKLVNYLRGQTGYEMGRTANTVQLYRNRGTVMGDTLESQPAFIANPVFNYTYPGYADYATNNAGRAGTVFVGSNDGMLHAFDAATGAERWAYVPSMVIPNLWKLADTNYANGHMNFVNGSAIISDVCVATNCAAATAADWRTILVGGLNGGGRGYFALDITVPATPKLLWEFTTTQDIDLGYSYGRPNITRRADGTWVVVVTSGYNNVSPGSGLGYLFVLKASDGTILSKISTGAGNTTTPNGLAQVSIWNDASGGNQAGYAYGGDLQGNVWRFDINSTAAATIGTGSVMKFATLYSDAAGTLPQPITTPPVLGLVDPTHVIYVGTGKYLEASDLTNTQLQTLYALKDVGAAATWFNNPRAYTATSPKMVQQVIVQVANSNTRTETPPSGQKAVDFTSDLGWFVDFPDLSTGSERVNIAPQLILGTLLIPTIVPSSTVCSPGGYGWFNYFDYTNGWATGAAAGNSNVSIKSDSPYVGFNVIYEGGKPRVLGVTANGDIGEIGGKNCTGPNCVQFATPPQMPTFQNHRAIWHEVIP